MTLKQIQDVLNAIFVRLGIIQKEVAKIEPPKPTKHKLDFIILHHTATDRDTTTFTAVNDFHRQQWAFKSKLGFYIGYQYFITANGRVYQGREDLEEGAHTKGHNQNTIGICLTGDFDTEYPTHEQLVSLNKLLDTLQDKYDIDVANIRGHRNFTQKTCPGDHLFQWLVEYKMQRS